MSTIQELEQKVIELSDRLSQKEEQMNTLIDNSRRAIETALRAYKVDHYGYVWVYSPDDKLYHKTNMRVCTPEIADRAIQSRHLVSRCITSEKIGDKAVTRDKLADSVINELRMLDVNNLFNDSYTKEEIDEMLQDIDIDLTGYATESWVTQQGFLKAISLLDYYNKDTVDQLLRALKTGRFKVVDELPEAGEQWMNTIFLVPVDTTQADLDEFSGEDGYYYLKSGLTPYYPIIYVSGGGVYAMDNDGSDVDGDGEDDQYMLCYDPETDTIKYGDYSLCLQVAAEAAVALATYGVTVRPSSFTEGEAEFDTSEIKGYVNLQASKSANRNIKNEFIVLQIGEGSQTRYVWEQIGSTAIDLSEYAKSDALKNYYTKTYLDNLLTQLGDAVDGKYKKPVGGIPKSDLAKEIKDALDAMPSDTTVAAKANKVGEGHENEIALLKDDGDIMVSGKKLADLALKSDLGKICESYDRSKPYKAGQYVSKSEYTNVWALYKFTEDMPANSDDSTFHQKTKDVTNHIFVVDGQGNLVDSGKTIDNFLTEHQSLADYAKKSELFSKSYNDLTDKPTWNDIKPSDGITQSDLAEALRNKINAMPSSENVESKANKVGEGHENEIAILKADGDIKASGKKLKDFENVQADWNQTDSAKEDFIKNKPTLFSGSYTDLTDKPTIPSKTSELTNDSEFVKATTLASVSTRLKTEAATTQTLTAAIQTLYRYDSPLTALNINLPLVDDGLSATIIVQFKTGSSFSGLTIGGSAVPPGSTPELSTNTYYELNFLYNGVYWMMAYNSFTE